MNELEIKRQNDRVDALKGEPFTMPDFKLSNYELYIQVYYRFTLPYIDNRWNDRILTDLHCWDDALKHNSLLNRDNLKIYLGALIKDRHTRPKWDMNIKVRK